MTECCCTASKAETETIPTGWQCPCCRVVYGPDVESCFCCVEDYEVAPDAAEIAPPSPPGPPVSSNPWHFTIQPSPSFSVVTVSLG